MKAHDKTSTPLRTLTAFLLILVLTACNQPNSTPEETLHQFITHIQNGELEQMATLTTNPDGIDFLNPANQNGRRLAIAAGKNLEVEVLEVKVTGSTATVRVRGTNASVPQILDEVLSPANLAVIGRMGGDPTTHAQDMLVERVGRRDAPTRTREVTATLKATRGEWRVQAPNSSGSLTPFWSMLFAYADQ